MGLKLYNSMHWVPGSLGHGPSGQLLDAGTFSLLAVEAPLH